LAGTAQAIVCDAPRERSGGQIVWDEMVVGKKAQVLQLPCGVINNGGGLSPSSKLGVALLAQIKKGFLERTAIAR